MKDNHKHIKLIIEKHIGQDLHYYYDQQGNSCVKSEKLVDEKLKKVAKEVANALGSSS